MKRCEFIAASISVAAICTAGLKVGGVRPSAMRRDRSEWSSSTIANRKVGRFGRGAGGSGVDRNGEGIGDKHQHDRVGAEAAQLLDHQPVDVGQMQPQLGEPIARRAASPSSRHAVSPVLVNLPPGSLATSQRLLLPQQYMSGNEVADREDRKDERIEPEIRKASPLVKVPTLIG